MPVLNQEKTNQKTTTQLKRLMDDWGWSVSRVGTIINVYPGIVDSWLKEGNAPSTNKNLNKLITVHYKVSKLHRTPEAQVEFLKTYNAGSNCSLLMMMYDETGLTKLVNMLSKDDSCW